MRLIKSFVFVLCLLCVSVAECQAMNIRNSDDLAQAIVACEGKQVVIVNFYASWCGPCRMEIPDLIAIRDKYPQSQLTMIGINLDDSKAEMRNFNKSVGINYPTFHDSGEIHQFLEIEGIPYNIVFAKSGEAIYAESGVVDYNDLVEMIEYGLKN